MGGSCSCGVILCPRRTATMQPALAFSASIRWAMDAVALHPKCPLRLATFAMSVGTASFVSCNSRASAAVTGKMPASEEVEEFGNAKVRQTAAGEGLGMRKCPRL